MSLHTGLLWLADGFEKYEKLAEPDHQYSALRGSGDGNNCNTKVAHKLNLNQTKNCQNRKLATHRCVSSAQNFGATPRPKSATIRRTKSSGYRGSYLHQSQSRGTKPSHSSRHQQDGTNFRAPSDLTPRTGAWTSQSVATHLGDHDMPVEVERRYRDLPDHPDLRYFDRHNRCFNNTHCGVNLHLSRPQTACASGRHSLEQCECCGEITSKIRYKYAPTGSAMTANNSGNKTYLYPEKIMSYDAYTGRQRPSSAPVRTASQKRPLPPNYLIRGDIPHFCNFVTPCSVYDKVTGERLLDKDEMDLFELFCNYGKNDAEFGTSDNDDLVLVEADEGQQPELPDEEEVELPNNSLASVNASASTPAVHSQPNTKPIGKLNSVISSSERNLGSKIELSSALNHIGAEKISVVNIGNIESKRRMNPARKRPPTAVKSQRDSKPQETFKPSTRKKKGLFDKDSSETLIASAPSPLAEVHPPEVEPPVALEPEPASLEVVASQLSTTPVPPSNDVEEKMGEAKRKHLRKVGTGRGEDDDFFDIDFSTRSPLKMQAWMNGRLALSKRSSRFELPIDMLLLETMTPLQYLNRYCVVTSRRQMLYDKIFMKHRNGYSNKLGFQELQKALSDVLIQSIDDEKMKLVINMLLIQEDIQIDRKLFYGISAFAERLLYPIFVRGDQSNMETQKEKIESADFYALKWKFHGVKVNSAIRALLDAL